MSYNISSVHELLHFLQLCRNLEGNTVKQSVLECYASMATRHKDDVENALVKLQELSSQDSTLREKERVCTMLAIATGLTLLRQTAKAKNQLRAIDRMPYKWDDGDDFERAWLMLAYIHLQVHTFMQFSVSNHLLNQTEIWRKLRKHMETIAYFLDFMKCTVASGF